MQLKQQQPPSRCSSSVYFGSLGLGNGGQSGPFVAGAIYVDVRASEEAAGQDAADAEAAGEAREHLWFDVHAVEGDRVEATLLNAPYHVPTLACGDRGWHDLALLSDWVVLGPHGQYGPDAIHALEDAVAERPDA